jgi:hypothetical protein
VRSIPDCYSYGHADSDHASHRLSDRNYDRDAESERDNGAHFDADFYIRFANKVTIGVLSSGENK